MQVNFKFEPDAAVTHANHEISGVVVGSYIDRNGVQSALVEYVTDNGRVERTYFDEDQLRDAD